MSASNREPSRRAIVALGANLPHAGLEPQELLAAAVNAMRGEGLRPLRWSGVWGSPAWPPSGQPDYANAVVEIEAGALAPEDLLALLMRIERAFGRERRERNAARTLDLDIVDFGGLVLEEGGLALPHPRASKRAFVLAPLAEAAPDWRHPVSGKTASELLAALPDREEIRRIGALAV